MRIDLEHDLRTLAGEPTRAFDLDGALRRTRRRRRAVAGGTVAGSLAVAVVAVPLLGNATAVVPVIDDTGVEVADEPDAPDAAPRPLVGDGDFLVRLEPVSANVMADLQAQVQEQALDEVVAGRPVPHWDDLVVDVSAIDPDFHDLVRDWRDRHTDGPRGGDRPILRDDPRTLLEELSRRALAETPVPPPTFDVERLQGPPGADDRPGAWYMDEADGGFHDAAIEQQLGGVLDDLCDWLAAYQADADVAFQRLQADTGRFTTLYSLPPQLPGRLLDRLGQPPFGDGLDGWLYERCLPRLGDWTSWPDPADLEEDLPPDPDAGRDARPSLPAPAFELAMVAVTDTRPDVLAEPSEGEDLYVFAYADGRTVRDQHGLAAALRLAAYEGGWPFHFFERLEGPSQHWPPGSVAVLNGAGDQVRQVLVVVDGTVINLSADDAGVQPLLEDWAREAAWELHRRGQEPTP